jgi:hypothetical protein
MSYHTSFLVSCCGAYDDSGMGTGGLVCVHEGRAVVVDKSDSTGLCLSGETIFRAVRPMRSVLGYDANGLKYWLRLPSIRDVHDVLLIDGAFVCASTGLNELCWFDPLGNLRRRWQAQGERDAWHLNCLWQAEGRLYASAFGEFASHRGWAANSLKTGFIFDVETGEKVVEGLSGPHNPRFVDGDWVVCNSHTKTLTISKPSGQVQEVRLESFTRGLAFDERYFYVGESANRKDPVLKDHSMVAIVDRATLAVVDRIKIPIPEIYEIALLPVEFAAAMATQPGRFAFDVSDERVRALEVQVERGYDEIRKLKQTLNDERSASLRYRLGTFRRKLMRAISLR